MGGGVKASKWTVLPIRVCNACIVCKEVQRRIRKLGYGLGGLRIGFDNLVLLG